MPFKIVKQPDGRFKLYNEHKKVYAKASFKTKEAAARQGINWMRYRKEKGVLRGNKIVKAN